MADPRFDIWNVLHDGEITVVAHEKPDTLVMFVSIPYLRRRITPLGDSVRLRLGGFRSINFSNDIGDSYSEIADVEGLEILSTDAEAMPAKIQVTEGTLTIDFDSLDIGLDTGQPVTYEQLCRASEEYWNEWSAKHQQV